MRISQALGRAAFAPYVVYVVIGVLILLPVALVAILIGRRV